MDGYVSFIYFSDDQYIRSVVFVAFLLPDYPVSDDSVLHISSTDQLEEEIKKTSMPSSKPNKEKTQSLLVHVGAPWNAASQYFSTPFYRLAQKLLLIFHILIFP